jgi:DNA excision repair protein ERCC-3
VDPPKHASQPSIEELKNDVETKMEQLKREVDRITKEYEAAFVGLGKKGYKLDNEKVRPFLERFWHTYPTKNPNEWEVAVPIFIPFNIGWWDRQEGGYNIFTVNRYTRWLGEEVPTFISHEISLPPSMPITIDGLELKFPEGQQETVEKLYGNHLSLVEKDKASIRQGHEFDVIAEIIDSGSLPFVPHPISSDDLRESDFTQIWDELKEKYLPLDIFDGKYSFQGDSYKAFEKYGAIGVFWAMGFGKTILGTYIFSRIKGRKALVVPTKTLKEHWEQFFRWNCPRLLNEVEIYTYQGMSRQQWNQMRDKEFAVVGFDECHFLPADSFSKLATLRAKYRFGLSATPYREDGRTNYIMALTGFPLGLDWRTLMQVLGKEYHSINVHVVRDMESKYDLVRGLYNPERRTIIFVNLIAVGDRISSMLELPFIHGQTKKRLELMKKSKSFVASRVMELGISIKDLEHIIEADFLFGSRREEVQRTGRLMHSLAVGKVHDIIMTKDEYEQYGKRLYGLYEKGFRFKLVPHLSGVEAPTMANKIRKKKTTSIKGDLELAEKLHKEGYFQNERKFGDVKTEIEKRGGKVEAASLFKKLDSMVRKEKLYKIKTDEGYKFKSR